MATKWGFLRKTKELAQAAGIDNDTGYHRTGLEDYLKVIFPDVSEDEWVHDKAFGEHNGINYTRDVSEVGHWGNGAYEVRFPLKNNAEIDFVFNLLRQTINKNKE